ncbi:hypothetical protein DIPPA_24468 [Diplonema papillatum]|nr:hypothetical protein DIPPA_24468 [Diplonema papillatum]
MVGGRSVLRSYPVPPAGGQIAGQAGDAVGRLGPAPPAAHRGHRIVGKELVFSDPVDGASIVVAGVEGGGCIYKVQGETDWRPAVTVAELQQDDDGYYLLFPELDRGVGVSDSVLTPLAQLFDANFVKHDIPRAQASPPSYAGTAEGGFDAAVATVDDLFVTRDRSAGNHLLVPERSFGKGAAHTDSFSPLWAGDVASFDSTMREPLEVPAQPSKRPSTLLSHSTVSVVQAVPQMSCQYSQTTIGNEQEPVERVASRSSSGRGGPVRSEQADEEVDRLFRRLHELRRENQLLLAERRQIVLERERGLEWELRQRGCPNCRCGSASYQAPPAPPSYAQQQTPPRFVVEQPSLLSGSTRQEPLYHPLPQAPEPRRITPVRPPPRFDPRDPGGFPRESAFAQDSAFPQESAFPRRASGACAPLPVLSEGYCLRADDRSPDYGSLDRGRGCPPISYGESFADSTGRREASPIAFAPQCFI